MSSAGSYPPIAVEIRSSHSCLVFVAVLSLTAMSCPWFAGLPPFSAAMVSLLALPAARPLFRCARGELSRIVWQPDGRWQLLARAGTVHDDARLQPGILANASLVALHWQCATCGKRFRAILVADNCDTESLRRLRVRLGVTADGELFGGEGGM